MERTKTDSLNDNPIIVMELILILKYPSYAFY